MTKKVGTSLTEPKCTAIWCCWLYKWTSSLNSIQGKSFQEWISGFENRYTKLELQYMEKGFNRALQKTKI